MSKPVVGVDPGGRFTGIIARYGPDLLAHWLTRRTVDGGRHTYTLAGYIALVLDDLAEAKRRALTHAGPGYVVAVEDLQEPNPHMGLTNIRGALDTAAVLGAVLAHFPEAILVPPGRHGTAMLRLYPSTLVGPRERTGHGKAPLQHCRAAWDIAGAGAVLALMQQGRPA
jgi:hypothetical protein